MFNEFNKKIVSFPKNASLYIIRLYQKYLSRDHSIYWKHLPGCKYYPTCSEYTYQSINKFGFLRGFMLGSYRIIRCNPFSKGGADPIPKKFLGKK